MRFSKTLSLYIFKNLLLNLFYVFISFCLIAFILDLLEVFRKVQGKEILIVYLLKIVLYKVPFLVFTFLPFIFLFGSILTFTKLNNNFEIAAAKSAGVSIWSLSLPIVAVTLVLSTAIICVFQPLSAIFLDKTRILENKYFEYKSNRVSLNPNGVWLHDLTENSIEEKFINAKHVSKLGQALTNVKVYVAGYENNFSTNYVANSALLKDNQLIMQDAICYEIGKQPISYKEISIPTSLVAEQIQESIADPEIIPFWDLKNFIAQIKQAGFSTLKHELYYKSFFASPLEYLSLILISLACSINLPRKGKMGAIFITGSVISIFIFFVDKMANVMAQTSILPINLAVIAPSFIYFLLSCIILIHFEENV